ncbi:DUF2247 family protein [Ralstonia pseudosolanacearum]|uniref:DUF2247 family protein n=1 Tax=Ralstonia pseudosolanacearum TaxID=1310165 RepID=UPI0026751559|nr:DUF2247 family protein [Ralstonia pseudosolanacearum]MDO3621701.1 DUF2247 family protein [Ralstonia pseudosolanacearum]
MIDRLFLKLLERGQVDWGVILSGISGIPGGDVLGAELVRRFADEELSQMDTTDPILGEVSEVSLFNGAQLEDARKNVAHICEMRNIDLDRAKRKWRAVALEELLSHLGSDPVYDLIALSEFWTEWGSATDAPYVAQGVGNSLAPEDYYTKRNLDEAINRHREWLTAEIAYLS